MAGADPVRQRADCSNQTGFKCCVLLRNQGLGRLGAAGGRTCRRQAQLEGARSQLLQQLGRHSMSRHKASGTYSGRKTWRPGSTGFCLSGAGGHRKQLEAPKPDRSSKKELRRVVGLWWRWTGPAWMQRKQN